VRFRTFIRAKHAKLKWHEAPYGSVPPSTLFIVEPDLCLMSERLRQGIAVPDGQASAGSPVKLLRSTPKVTLLAE
jgi:hypothetical protein